MLRRALLLHACLLQPAVLLAFNLDSAQVIRKDGEPGSLFGFSLAMHRQLNPDKAMVLIGAPRARALGRQKASVTGGLYKCEMTQSNHCERIDFDNEEDLRIENKENQWMGVTVQSQGPGGKIVTCAHRYQRRLFVNTPQESHDITGRCYVLSQDLTIDSSSDEDGGNWNFCEGRARGHEMFGSCQQGLAATFTKDYHYVVFGAPGAYNWKGVVRVEQKNNTLLEMGIYDDGPYEVGDEHLLNPELVPVPANSYLGFSLDSGHHLTRSRSLTVVAGAPRANHSGAVVLLKKESDASARLLVEHILHGPGLGSAFGYDLAVVDLNGDGWQDIIVGAPQFYMKDGDVGGAVFVYINKAGRWERVTPLRLNGTKDSMFGLAVESTGDINQDSYEDFAVGAPHDDDGTGKVYIYHGSEQGIKTSPAQILSGREHSSRLFGYSLAGNMDLDGNWYPDLAVGSLSDTAFIYRARPIISIRRDVKISPQEIDLTIKTCEPSVLQPQNKYVHRFSTYGNVDYVSSDVWFHLNAAALGYSVEADGDRRKQGLTSRVMFLNKTRTESDYQLNGTVDLRGQNQESCVKIKGRLRQAKCFCSCLLLLQVNFVKEGCGRDHICRSNLKMKYSLYYKPNNLDEYFPKNNLPEFHMNYERKDLAVRVTVSNMNGDDAYETKLVGSFPDTLPYSGVRSRLTEKQILCDADPLGTQAECDLGNPFKRDSETTFYIILSTAGLSLETTELEIDLQLQTTSVQENIPPVKIKAEVITELFLLVLCSEASPSQLSFGGVVRGESAMKSEEEVGSSIRYTFTINNLWKSLIPSVKASLHIHWPKLNKDGKWLLYLMEASSSEGSVCSPESEINPLKLIQVRTLKLFNKYDRPSNKPFNHFNEKEMCFQKSSLSRAKRETPRKDRKDYASVSTSLLVVKASIVLHTQAENIILKTPDTTVSGSAAARDDGSRSALLLAQLFSSRTPQVTVSVSPDSEVAQYGGVPWWIILVAVLAGILILALLVFLLWKCGFFKRATKDQYDAAYHKAEIHVQPSDKDKVSAEA
uniref:Integrin alpha-2 domain-containing protein n=1 Tax=Salarias fasciatus TaxID=181472 RepID=A0A672JKJ1_SALFA